MSQVVPDGPLLTFLKKFVEFFVSVPSLALGLVAGVIVFIMFVRIPFVGTVIAPILALGAAWYVISKLTEIDDIVKKAKEIFGDDVGRPKK